MNLYKLCAGCMLDVTWVAHTLHKSTTRTLASTLTSQVKGTDNGGPSFCSVRFKCCAASPVNQQILKKSDSFVGWGFPPSKLQHFLDPGLKQGSHRLALPSVHLAIAPAFQSLNQPGVPSHSASERILQNSLIIFQGGR